MTANILQISQKSFVRYISYIYIFFSNLFLDASLLALQNQNIEGSDDFILRVVLEGMDVQWRVYDHLDRYLATRVDVKIGPIKISTTAK